VTTGHNVEPDSNRPLLSRLDRVRPPRVRRRRPRALTRLTQLELGAENRAWRLPGDRWEDFERRVGATVARLDPADRAKVVLRMLGYDVEAEMEQIRAE